jgi:hypothetical protein
VGCLALERQERLRDSSAARLVLSFQHGTLCYFEIRSQNVGICGEEERKRCLQRGWDGKRTDNGRKREQITYSPHGAAPPRPFAPYYTALATLTSVQ